MKAPANEKPFTTPDGEVREDLTAAELDAMFAKATRVSALPESLQAKLRTPGRPKAEVTKERITIRLSPEVLRRFRAAGPGWQTRMDAALRDWLKSHSPAKGGV